MKSDLLLTDEQTVVTGNKDHRGQGHFSNLYHPGHQSDRSQIQYKGF